jgi:hypothetical protein
MTQQRTSESESTSPHQARDAQRRDMVQEVSAQVSETARQVGETASQYYDQGREQL